MDTISEDTTLLELTQKGQKDRHIN